MFARTLPPSIAAAGLALFAFAPSAEAHIRLLEPLARHEITGFDTGIKSCPCGVGTSNRSCDATANASDPNRSEQVTRYEAGSTIVLRFDEYVGHSGSYRVAFDDDGAEIVDFNANVLVPMVSDPAGQTGNVGEGSIWEIEVTLPDMTCDNCTLQLVQAMNGDTTNPVSDPSTVDSYYTCVDIELVPPGTLEEEPGEMDPDEMDGEGGESGGMTGSSAGGSGSLGTVPPMGDGGSMSSGMMLGGNNPVGSGSTNMGSTQTPNVTPPTGSPMINMGSSNGSSGGCSIGARSSGTSFALLGLAGLFVSAALRRRR